MTHQRSRSSKVSIVMPTYNRAYIINRAIISVLNQTFTDWELIVVDDSSKDNTLKIVDSYQDSRVILLSQDPAKKGAAAARNVGIAASSGEYVAFIDSDDEWLPKKLQKQLEVFNTTDLDQVGVVNCGRKIYYPDSTVLSIPSRRGWVRQDLLALRGEISNINMIISKSAAQGELWFDESLKSSEEWDLQIRLAGVCQYDSCDDILVNKYEVNDDRVYTGISIPDGLSVVMQKYDNELLAMPGVRARHWGGIGLTYWKLGNSKAARISIRRALKGRFWSLRLHIYFMLTFTGKLGPRIFREIQHGPLPTKFVHAEQ
ncbi:MAG: glycosyltransferase family 2 protein [Dehalococcoidia bacterium]